MIGDSYAERYSQERMKVLEARTELRALLLERKPQIPRDALVKVFRLLRDAADTAESTLC